MAVVGRAIQGDAQLLVLLQRMPVVGGLDRGVPVAVDVLWSRVGDARRLVVDHGSGLCVSRDAPFCAAVD